MSQLDLPLPVLPPEVLVHIFKLAATVDLPPTGYQAVCAPTFFAKVSLLSKGWRTFGQAQLLKEVTFGRGVKAAAMIKLTAALRANPTLVPHVKRISTMLQNHDGEKSEIFQRLLETCTGMESLHVSCHNKLDLGWLVNSNSQSPYHGYHSGRYRQLNEVPKCLRLVCFAGLRELVADHIYNGCVLQPPLCLPSLRHATFIAVGGSSGTLGNITHPRAFPNLDTLTLIHCGGDWLPRPYYGSDTIIARVTTGYHQVGPGSDTPRNVSEIASHHFALTLWVLDLGFQISAEYIKPTIESKLRDWAASGVPVHFVHCQHIKTEFANSWSAVALALLDFKHARHPVLHELKILYVDEKLDDVREERQGLVDAAARVAVEIVFEPVFSGGKRWHNPPHFLAMCEKLAKEKDE